MKKTYDISLILAIGIITFFVIFIIIYVFSINNSNDTNGNNEVLNYIYSENTNEQNNNVQNNTENILQTEYKDIASYTTKIQDKDKNRVYNIKLACKRLNGHIINAGSEFSFNNTMGTMGKEDGYKKAIGFDNNGNNIKVYGGGMCQISSTLYNAVLIARLKVTERHAHSKRVYYVPKNKDATVFYGGPDLKFINTSNSNIMICATTDGYTVNITLKEEHFIDNK